jgi:YD repeat-containing protein
MTIIRTRGVLASLLLLIGRAGRRHFRIQRPAMNATPLRAGALSCALLAAIALVTPALAQIIEPPREDTISPTGVSYKSGNFTYHQRDLSIGDGEFPNGLTLDRSYSSGMDSSFSGLSSQGWTHNLHVKFSMRVIPNPLNPPPPQAQRWLYSLTFGAGSASFTGGSTNPTGGFVGTYTPTFQGGESLVFTGTQTAGNYTFTGSDGTVITLAPPGAGMRPVRRVAPDGTTLDYAYDADGLRSVFSNRGYALLFEFGNLPNGGRGWVKACAVSLVNSYVTPLSSCPSGAETVAYAYASSPTYSGRSLLTSVTDPTGATTSYSYVSVDHLGCVQLPGQATCNISNSYNVCQRLPSLSADPAGLRLMDSVLTQQTATGETYSYSFPANPICPDQTPQTTDVTMTLAGAATQVRTNQAGQPTRIIDPLGRTSAFNFPVLPLLPDQPTRMAGETRPELDGTTFIYDSRGNITEQRQIARPGTGLADIVTTAAYPASCSAPRICNKPTSVTDARGNTTDYTYDAAHGGVLTETGPAVGGVRPQTRHSYAQRYAWIAASGGGYVQAATPVWVRTASSMCRTSAASTTGAYAPCSVAGDEVLTQYDYGTGDSSHGNNLQLRGQAVTATDGGATTTLRTCYGYDAQGNRISQTSPNANLTSCP